MVLLALLPLLHGVVAAQSETGECVKNMKGVHHMLATGDGTQQNGFQVYLLDGFWWQWRCQKYHTNKSLVFLTRRKFQIATWVFFYEWNEVTYNPLGLPNGDYFYWISFQYIHLTHKVALENQFVQIKAVFWSKNKLVW